MSNPGRASRQTVGSVDGIPYWKMSGSGNDFIVVDNRRALIPVDREVAFTQAVCDRDASLGADGVVLIEHPNPSDDSIPVDFAWRYRNADGSEGEFCGNGAMCAARYAFLNGISDSRTIFTTPAGMVFATVADGPTDDRVAIGISDPSPVGPAVRLSVEGRSVTVHAVTVGVPHAVTFVDDIDNPFPEFGSGPDVFAAVGRAIRHHPHFAPAGTNLNAIAFRADGALLMRTYERGVEAETLACGSGAIASAAVATTLGRAASPVPVVVRGGNTLVASFSWDTNRRLATNVSLAGHAQVITTGALSRDVLGS
ncbi:MAG TPA: diaminopimelate epimerase [Thermomicrobiales bacterium]|nr:diaminopimelate epimerase [Thermomicrobiales bacterium]